MKRKFEILRATLEEFAQQDEFPMLLVGLQTDGLTYALHFLQALEQSLPYHLVALFSQPFRAPDPWMDEIAEAVRLQLDYAAPARVERGEPPAPPLPSALGDPRVPAAQRLLALLEYLPRLLPGPDGYRVVVGLAPLECHDLEAFAQLMATVVPHPEPPEWMAQLRLVVWDDRDRALLSAGIRAWPAEHVLYYSDDFSAPALSDALSQDAADTALALDERMGALTQLAALDMVHKRHSAALDKYALLHEHYFQTEQPELQALSLLGAGDTLHAADDPAAAKLRLQQGIAVAMEHKSLAALVPLLLSAVGVCTTLEHFDDAESYADSGIKVAAGAVNPFAYCDFFAHRGHAQVALGRHGDAVASYDKAREQCKANAYHETWLTVLEREIELYVAADMVEEQRALERERGQVQAMQRESPRHKPAQGSPA